MLKTSATLMNRASVCIFKHEKNQKKSVSRVTKLKIKDIWELLSIVTGLTVEH